MPNDRKNKLLQPAALRASGTAVVGEPKLPQTGGARKAMEAIKKFRKIEPSDRLMKIISEYGKEDSKSEPEKMPSTAAREREV